MYLVCLDYYILPVCLDNYVNLSNFCTRQELIWKKYRYPDDSIDRSLSETVATTNIFLRIF